MGRRSCLSMIVLSRSTQVSVTDDLSILGSLKLLIKPNNVFSPRKSKVHSLQLLYKQQVSFVGAEQSQMCLSRRLQPGLAIRPSRQACLRKSSQTYIYKMKYMKTNWMSNFFICLSTFRSIGTSSEQLRNSEEIVTMATWLSSFY